MPAPVHQPPPSFTDIQFDTIGKPPGLLSRISAPDPGQMSFRSLSPVTLYPPPPVATRAPAPNSRTLAERIQAGPSQINPSAKPQSFHPTKEPRINRNRYVPANPFVSSGNLIPPIEVLPIPSESNTSQIQAANADPNTVRQALTPELVYPAPSLVTPTTPHSNSGISTSSNLSGSPKLNSSSGLLPQPTPSPISSTLSAYRSPNLQMSRINSSQVPDVAQPKAPQQQVAQDPSSAIYAQLREKSNALASFALPTSLFRTPSPFSAPLNISQLADGLRSDTNAAELSTIVLRHPYPQSKSASNGPTDQELSANDGNALALTSSKTPNMSASRSTHIESFVETVNKLKAVAEGAVKLQRDADRVFEAERTAFDERRKAFEERMLAREAECQAQTQAIHKQMEELRARERRLVALEEESRLREETRRARDAQRRARDDQRNLEDESRRVALQKEISDTMNVIEQAKAVKTQWHEEKEQERTLAQNNALPLQLSADIEPCIEKEDGMNEEEIKAVDAHNRSLVHRAKLVGKLKKQITWTRQSFETIQHMKVTRLQAAEAERCRVAEDAERQRVLAEQAVKWVDEEQLRRKEILSQQSAHADIQSQKTQVDTQAEYNRRRAQVLANRQQTTSENAARIRAERAGHIAVPTTDGDGPEDMDAEIDVDELASPLEHTVPLPGQKGAASRKPASPTKKTSSSQGTSGKVMLGAPSTTASRLSEGSPSSSMSTPVTSSAAPTSYKTPSFVSASTDVGRQVDTDAPFHPTQMASELHLSVSPPSNGSLPTSKKIALPSTPKSRTILASDINECIEWTLGPEATLSPAHRDANLRHIKKNRHRVEENAAGDRSVKLPVDVLPMKTIKTEEVSVRESHDQERSSSHPEGASARSTDAVVLIQNHNPSSPQAISNTNASHSNEARQTSAELVVKAPNSTLRADARVGSAGTSVSMSGLAPIRNSPDPWIMDASVVRQEWTTDPISPYSYSEPSESASRYDPNQHYQQNSHTSGRTRSPEPPGFTRSNGGSGESRRQHQRGVPRHSDHYTPPPTSATSSHPRHFEQNEAGAYGSALPPRPMSPMHSGRKRAAEHDNEDDNRDRRRPRGDHYAPGRDYRNPRGLTRRSPATATEWRRGSSTSPNPRGSIHDRLRSPSSSRQTRPHIERDTLERRGRNEGSYRPDYTNTADLRRTSDAGYNMEERPARREERDPRGDEPSLLGRISTPGGRGNTVRGRGRGRGDAGRGRGGASGRGRGQQPLQQRPLEERIAK